MDSGTSALVLALKASRPDGWLRIAGRASQAGDQQRLEALAKLGVVRSHPRTLAEYPEIRAVISADEPLLPGAQELARTRFALPTHGAISERLANQIVEALGARA